MSDEGIVQPSETRADIAVMIGDQAKIMLDWDKAADAPPVLCIQGNGVQLMLYPHGWSELGEVRQCDLDRASDLVMDVVKFRDAIHAKLKAQRAEAERRAAEEAAQFGHEPEPESEPEPYRPAQHGTI